MTFPFLHIPPRVLNGFPVNITKMAIYHDRIRGDGHLFIPRETRSRKRFSIFHPLTMKLVQISVAQVRNSSSQLLSYRLDKERLRVLLRRGGRYLLRSNLIGIEPAQLWELYIQLTQIQEAFRNLKGDLAVRPIYHQLEHRIEAHIFVAFIAYCLHVTLRCRLHKLAPGLTPRAVLEKFKTIQMIDVHLPTTDGRTVILPRL